MTTTAAPPAHVGRVATTRHLLMCPPEHFTVMHCINPWMDVEVPVDQELARRQWARLLDTYRQLSHRVDVMKATPGLPDMVFAANAGVVYDGRALVSNFAHPERQPESEGFLRWFRKAGFSPASIATAPNEGEGDVLTIGRIMLAGVGPRTTRAAHQELRAFFDVPVIALELVDPRFCSYSAGRSLSVAWVSGLRVWMST